MSKLFNYAQEHKFAIPAINCTSSSTVVASLVAARDAKSPIILQMSQGGAAYFAGKGVANGKQEASIAGGIAAAHYIRSVAPAYGIPVILHTDHCAKKLLPWLDGLMDADEKYSKEHGEPLFSSHMIDLSEEEVDWNIKTTAEYLKRAAPRSNGSRWKSVSLVVRRMVSTTRTLTTTLSTPSQRIFLPSTGPSLQSPHTSPLPLVLEMSTVSTSQETSSCTQSSSASTRSMSRMPSELRRTSQSSWSSTVDLDHLSKSSWMPLAMVSLRSTSILIFNTHTLPVSETMS